MTIATKAIPLDAVTTTEAALLLKVGLPWYRSLPWAGVESVRLDIDGESVGEPILIDGTPPSELRRRRDYWSIQRWAVMTFADPGGLHPGVEVDARVHLDILIPGPLLPDGRPMPFRFDATRRRVVVHTCDPALAADGSAPPDESRNGR